MIFCISNVLNELAYIVYQKFDASPKTVLQRIQYWNKVRLRKITFYYYTRAEEDERVAKQLMEQEQLQTEAHRMAIELTDEVRLH